MFAKSAERGQWWAVYVVVGIVLGVLLEIAAATIPFWSYNPWWLVFVVVILAFGLSPATLARWLWKQSLVVLFAVGSVLAFLIEGLSAVIPGYGWSFAPGFPLGIRAAFWRAVVLGLGGGLFILVAHTITHWIFVSIKKPNRDKACYEKYRPDHVKIEDIPDPFCELRKQLDSDPAKRQAADEFYNQLNPEGKKMLLSVDGGGAKGYITLHCLAKLEELTGRKCFEMFDFFAGTSTGSLIAAGMASGMSAHKLRLVYRCKIPMVLQDRAPVMSILTYLLRPNDPAKTAARELLDKIKLLPRNKLRFMYRYDKLWGLIEQVLSDGKGKLTTMGEIPKHLLITVKDVTRSETIFAVNCGPGTKAYADLPVAYAVMGSAAVPIILQPLLNWVDGGVGTYQNPCYRATFVATQVVAGQTNYGRPSSSDESVTYEKRYSPENTIHFSFGTGVRRNALTGKEAMSKKAHGWILYVISEGQEDGSDDQVRMTQEHFARDAGLDFRRFQIVLDPEILAEPVAQGGLGMEHLKPKDEEIEHIKPKDEEVEHIKRQIEKLEMDAHTVKELEILEMLGKAWAEALASDPDGKGIGFTRPQYPYVDFINDPNHPDAKRVYFPPATPPQLLPSYLIRHLPGDKCSGLRKYRSKRLPRLTDGGDPPKPGYITRCKEKIRKAIAKIKAAGSA
jgi:predicted acylesterase/phospholipase RssA